MTYSMNVSPRFKAYVPKDKTKPERVLRIWTAEEQHKIMTMYAKGFTIVEIKNKMGNEFTWGMVQKKIHYLERIGYVNACPTCGHVK